MFHEDNYQVTRHICPRNCYDSCPMLAYTRGGKIEKITGDSSLPGASGRLCAKGEQILAQVYHPRRLLYPMRQKQRGSGRWQRISWQEAIDIIAQKILALKKRYGSTLPLCLNKYSGNFGLLHYATEGMFNALGATTQVSGTPCFSSGLDAQLLDFGGNRTAPIRQLLKARLIILWGVNPAWTSIHTMPAIYSARQQGAKVVVIDPVYTETAHKADYYIQLRPGSDTALAILLLQILDRRGALRYDEKKISGQQELLTAVRKVNSAKLCHAIDQPPAAVEFLAGLIAAASPMHIWCGFGLQRHIHGGLTIRLIDALSMLTGNIGIPGGGVNFADMGMAKFPHVLRGHHPGTRFININSFAHELHSLTDPPVKMLWTACRDPLRQDMALNDLQKAWQDLELVVTADKFLTKTAQMSDIVLPVTTEFESLDVFGGYFRHHLGINEPAIPPRGEARSDLDIARHLSVWLNELAPGTSTFPAQQNDEELLDRDLPPELCRQMNIDSWQDLYNRPVLFPHAQIPWENNTFDHPDGRFHCCRLPDNIQSLLPGDAYPFHLITPHAQDFINGQNHTKADRLPKYPVVYIHPEAAARRGLTHNHPAIMENERGALQVIVKFRQDLAQDIIISPQGTSRQGGLNILSAGLPTDLGRLYTGAPGVAIYDTFVNIRALGRAD